MKQQRLILPIAAFAVFWSLGVFWLKPRMEKRLEESARAVLAADSHLCGRLGRMEVGFTGQTAVPTGKVRTAADAQRIEALLANEVRASALMRSGPGQSLNPVSSVRSELEVAPYPPGWLLLAVQGTSARLYGCAATPEEARDLASSLVDAWSAKGMPVTAAVESDPAAHDEASDVRPTLAFPLPPSDTRRVALHLARIGSAWENLPLDETDAFLRSKVLTAVVQDETWTSKVLPVIQQSRAARSEVVMREQQRLADAQKAPAHVFVAVRAADILLRGEVTDEKTKQNLLAEAVAVFPDHRVHEAVRVNAERGMRSGMPSLSAALLPVVEKKSYHLALGGGAWTALKWDGAREEPVWSSESLPREFDEAMLRSDSAAMIDWLQGGSDPAVRPVERARAAFVLLALFEGHVCLAGRVAEPSLREQMIQAVRQSYGAHLVMRAEDFTIDPQRSAAESLTAAVKTLPTYEGVPQLLIARAGASWQVLPLSAEALEPGGLAKSGAIPEPLSALEVEDVAAEVLEMLRVQIH